MAITELMATLSAFSLVEFGVNAGMILWEARLGDTEYPRGFDGRRVCSDYPSGR